MFCRSRLRAANRRKPNSLFDNLFQNWSRVIPETLRIQPKSSN